MTNPSTRALAPDASPASDLVENVRTILARGGLVAFPTETVYGIAARADLPSALEALRVAKRRPKELALTWHVGSTRALERFGRLSPMARRLVERYWPGPLTLVLPGVPAGLEACAHDGWTGVRMPAQRATAAILERLPFPVVMSSANLHDEAPLCDAAAVEARFASGPARAGRVDLVLDGGPSRLGEASCVLALGPGRFELLRKGLFTREQLRAVAGWKIAFVCTGNTCRSPLAEVYARAALAERLAVAPQRIGEFGFEVESRGVQADVGAPASKLSIEVARADGLDLSSHVARAAIQEQITAFDRVYGLTHGHVEALAYLLPPGRAKNVELLDPEGRDIPDPIGGQIEDYRRTADRIRAAIRARLDEWL